MAATFDGDLLRITLPSATSEIDVQSGLYSDWKEWFKTGTNAKYPIAFETTGGDAISATQEVSPYFFLRNDLGWRIAPAEEDAEVTMVGNLYARDPDLDIFVPTSGDYTVLINSNRSASSLTVSSGAAGMTRTQWISLRAAGF